MYAYNTVRDLKQVTKKFREGMYKEYMNHVIKEIPKCHQFNLDTGSYEAIKSMMGKNETRNLLFAGENAIDVNFPYDTFWLDFKSEEGIIYGFLIETITENKIFSVIPCYNFPDDNKWIMGLSELTISIGKAFTEREQISILSKHNKMIKPYTELYLDREEIDNNGNIFSFPLTTDDETREVKTVRHEMSKLKYLNMFLKISNCKNVSFENNHPTKKIKRKGKTKTVIDKRKYTYKTLVYKLIGGKKKKKSGISENSETGRTMPFHFRKGCFKEYYEKPLFGKIYGRFWVPNHYAGSLENGFSDKEYVAK